MYDDKKSKKIILKLQGSFARRREHSASYTAELRELAISAIGDGISRAEVARAAGLPERTLCNWKKRIKLKAPRELKILKKRSAPVKRALDLVKESAPLSIAKPQVRIYFRSGVYVELSVNEFSTSGLIEVLSGQMATKISSEALVARGDT